jgi:hypothetical protein
LNPINQAVRVVTQPLHIDEALENAAKAGAAKRLGRWLQKYSPLLIYRDPPYGLTSVEHQLRQRQASSAAAWAGLGSLADIQCVLEIIQREMSWPNSYFIPDDPATLVLSGRDFDSIITIMSIEERFGVSYSDSDVERITEEAWTLGQFVQDVAHRATRGSEVDPKCWTEMGVG